MPRAALLAVAIFAAAEIAARVAVSAGVLQEAPSLHGLLTKDLDRVRAAQNDVWLLGNSTLDHGINAKLFTELTGRPTIALSHGSATPRALAAMLSYYLDRTPYHPSAVLVFATEDDFNKNGYRAQRSRTYIDYAAGKVWQPQAHFALFTARQSIAEQISQLVRVGVRHRIKPNPKSGKVEYDGEPVDPDDKLQQELVQNFAFDDDAIEIVARTARAYHIGRVGLVIVPTTDVFAQFHNSKVPQMTCEQIGRRVAELCDKAGVTYLNTGGPSNVYSKFSDAHHLNDVGKDLYTSVVAQWFLSRSADPSAVARAGEQETSAKQAMDLLGLPPRVN